MQVRHVIGIALLFAAMPLQMYLMKYSRDFRALVSEISHSVSDNFRDVFADFTEYVYNANDYLQNVYDYIGWWIELLSDYDGDDDSDAQPEGYDDEPLLDNVIQDFRPPHLEYRVGDIVFTRSMIIGIIVGWRIDLTDLRKEPDYYLLVENNVSLVKENQYNMIRIENTNIQHSKIDYYFEHYDGTRYIPRKWLRQLYPKD